MNSSKMSAAALIVAEVAARRSSAGMLPMVVMLRFALPFCCRDDTHHRLTRPSVEFSHTHSAFSHFSRSADPRSSRSEGGPRSPAKRRNWSQARSEGVENSPESQC